jgi:hypothetical protein
MGHKVFEMKNCPVVSRDRCENECPAALLINNYRISILILKVWTDVYMNYSIKCNQFNIKIYKYALTCFSRHQKLLLQYREALHMYSILFPYCAGEPSDDDRCWPKHVKVYLYIFILNWLHFMELSFT